jgi:hypothetical protein
MEPALRQAKLGLCLHVLQEKFCGAGENSLPGPGGFMLVAGADSKNRSLAGRENNLTTLMAT